MVDDGSVVHLLDGAEEARLPPLVVAIDNVLVETSMGLGLTQMSLSPMQLLL